MRCVIIHPFDPLGPKVGGAEAFLKGLIKYAPGDIQIEYIGITANPADRPVKQWLNLKLGKKEFKFFPVLAEADENKKTLIPLTLRFVAALHRAKLNFLGKVLFFNRIDAAVLCRHIPAKIAIVHIDIAQQIKQQGSESLWARIPWLYFLLEKKILHSMEQIFTVSQKTADRYKLNYPQLENRVAFIPTWVDTQIFQQTATPKVIIRKSLGFSNGAVNGQWILFVGRLQEQKAPLRVVDVFRSYRTTSPDAKLIMIGEGNLQQRIKERIENAGLEGSIFLLRGMPQEQLAKFYQASDVLLLASNFEGMPMCVLEAFGCGLPVVTTDVGEVKRIVKNGFCGEVTKGFQPADIAKSLGKVLNNPGIYKPSNCFESVGDYTPEKALQPIYEKMRILSFAFKHQQLGA